MESNQLSAEEQVNKPKGHLRYETLLKAMPPDILQELARRKLEEIARIRSQPQQTPTGK